MSLPKPIQEQIAVQVIRTLYNLFEKFPQEASNNRNAPFQEAFMKAFSKQLANKVASVPVLISLSSWLHGLNTSLGQSFFENTAQILCGGEKKEFTKNKNNQLFITQTQKTIIGNIITDLSNSNCNPSLEKENALIFQNYDSENFVECTDFTADVFFQNHEQIVCIEIKTVKPNKATFKAEKQKILEAKAALKNKFFQKNVDYFLAFPFDPLDIKPCGYDKKRFMEYSVDFSKFFDEAEILLAGEFWDFLSGYSQTMENLLTIINAIATPNFMEEINFLEKVQNRILHKEKYLNLLAKWFLFQEYELVQNYKLIQSKITAKTENAYFTNLASKKESTDGKEYKIYQSF